MISLLFSVVIQLSLVSPTSSSKVITHDSPIGIKMDSTTEKVIQHHFASFRKNDLEEILKDYSDESIIFTPGKEYRGLKEIRELFVSAFKSYPQSGTTIIIDKMITEGNLAYVVWHGETPNFVVSFSTATYVVNNNKILRHTIGRVTEDK